MAIISILSQLITGAQRSIDLSTNTLAVGTIRVGGSAGTDLTKTALDILTGGSADASSLHNHNTQYYTKVQTDAAYVPLASKGAALGVASLDSGGKVPVSQLPNSILEYQGTYNVATNTPTLADFASGSAAGTSVGDVYKVTVGGTRDFGSGSITFVVGDYAILNALGKWELAHSGADAVVSVNGQSGVVSLTSTNIAEGTNLYFTTARAKAAAVANSITSGITDVAPSQDSVFTALAGKANTSLSNLISTAIPTSLLPNANNNYDLGSGTFAWGSLYAVVSRTNAFTTIAGNGSINVMNNLSLSGGAIINMNGTNITNLAAGVAATDAVNVSQLTTSTAPTLIAGEAFAATTLFAVRFAKAADAGFVAGRVYKASNDATTVDNFYAIGLTRPTSTTSAAGSLVVVKYGIINVPTHGFTIGAPLFLSAAGAVTETAPTAVNSAIVRVGMVVDASNIEVHIHAVGVN